MKRAVFLDRDGTINRDVSYLDHPDQIELIPGAARAVKLLNEAGFILVVVTNQSGVARGFIPEKRLPLIKARLLDLLEAGGAKIDGYYYCPHYPEGTVEKYSVKCNCRKPEPGMLKQAEEDLNIDLKRSYVVGDKICDVELGRNAGTAAIMVKTGCGEAESKICDPPPDYMAADLLDAAQWIIKNRAGQSLA